MAQSLTVFIPEPEWEPSHRLLEAIAHVRVGDPRIKYTEERLCQELGDVDALIITSQHHVTRRVIEAAPKLKAVVKYGSKPGADNVDLAAATEHGVVVSYTPGANSDSVAEHTITLALALLKRLYITSSELRRGRWRDLSKLGSELMHKTVGIVGFGTIGRKVAKKLSSFDVRILVHDPYVADGDVLEAGAVPVDLMTLMRESDVITLHVLLSPETTGLIGEDELRQCKPTAFLLNTARGALVDEASLLQALREGWLAGAGLDVFDQEPLPADHPLLELNNVVVTPHYASCTFEAYENEANMAAEEVVRVLTGKRPQTVANPGVLRVLSLAD